jgi:hypothetical protein
MIANLRRLVCGRKPALPTPAFPLLPIYATLAKYADFRRAGSGTRFDPERGLQWSRWRTLAAARTG